MLIRPVAPIISSEPWQIEAACAEVGPAPWDTTGDALDDLNRAAIAICVRCPVRSECLELAMRTETGGKQYRSGIFGGRTPAQRAAAQCGQVMSDLGPDDWTYDSEPVLEAFEQSLIAPIATPEPVQVDALDATERGDGGF